MSLAKLAGIDPTSINLSRIKLSKREILFIFSSSDVIQKCLGMQLEELETLSAIFCGPGEFHTDDPSVPADIHKFLEGKLDFLNSEIDFRIRFEIDGCPEKVEVICLLPHYYPVLELPSVQIRSKNISNNQQNCLKKLLESALEAIQKPEPFIYELITWLQESEEVKNALKEDFVPEETINLESKVDLERLWIYSHHLKSKKKRKDIVKNASDLSLTGFSLPGKPGIICVEGLQENTQEFWRLLRQMKWQKITVKMTENKSKPINQMQKFLKFKNFQEELTFVEEDEVLPLNMSTFMKFLDVNQCLYVKTGLFGFE